MRCLSAGWTSWSSRPARKLFLDEIGNLSPGLQTKLLSVLQNNEIYPVGSSVPRKVDVRIISATNTDLQKMIREKTFREDLYYRINAIELEIPPLRKRMEDISTLAEFFLKKYSDQYHKPGINLSDRVMEQLMSHPWPGNIRELEHAIEKAVILSETGRITDINLYPGAGNQNNHGVAVTLNLEEHEKMVIRQALREVQGNISSAARSLGINRSTLYQKMKKYGI